MGTDLVLGQSFADEGLVPPLPLLVREANDKLEVLQAPSFAELIESLAQLHADRLLFVEERNVEDKAHLGLLKTCRLVDSSLLSDGVAEGLASDVSHEVHESEHASTASEGHIDTSVGWAQTQADGTGQSVAIVLNLAEELSAETFWSVVILRSQNLEISIVAVEHAAAQARTFLESVNVLLVNSGIHNVANGVVSAQQFISSPRDAEVFAKHTSVLVEASKGSCLATRLEV